MTNPSKKETVRVMFDDISPRYDFLNHFLSFGMDFLWRKKLVKQLILRKPAHILDIATGTGDLAIASIEAGPRTVTGLDLSDKMLEIGRKKIAGLGLERIIDLRVGDAEALPFNDGSFDVVTVAFGVRNFENLGLGLSEMRRVLRPGGSMMILEFSHPKSFPVKQLYAFYSYYVIPAFGRIISGNTQAYRYLPESVAAFPSGKKFLDILAGIGLKNPRQIRLSAGIASIYLAEK